MSKEFQEELDQAYEKSLKLALAISKSGTKNRDQSLITHIRKNYQDFRDIQGKHIKQRQSVNIKVARPTLAKKSQASSFSKSEEAKAFLSKSIEESNLNIKLSRAGKSSLRYAENFPNKLLKFSKSNKPKSPLPHVSLLNGKTEQPLDLPYYKEYLEKSPERLEEKNQTLEKIEKCEESLKNFYKSISGMELFCANNPGVPWNNDKKVLHKLFENPNYKGTILRLYNESLYGAKPKVKSNLSRLSLIYKKHSGSRSSIDSTPFGRSNTPIQSFGKPNTPIPSFGNEKGLVSIQEERPSTAVVYDSPEIILQRCSDRFLNVKNEENMRLINIFKKIKKNRPWCLKQKGELIMHDSEVYKNKLYTFRKFEAMRKKINSRQEKRLKENKSQAKIYIHLLDQLIEEKAPSDLEIGFANLIRHILGEGWILSKELISAIEANLSPLESKELSLLISIIKKKKFDV